jgi:hypothetical protein
MSQGQQGQGQHDQEVILWLNEIRKSVWHKLHTKHTKIVTQTQEITNYNVILNRENQGTIKIPLVELDDALILNSRSVSQGSYSRFSGGRYFRPYYGSSNSNSRQVGDLVFLRGGKPEIIFRNISAPGRVQSLVNAEKKILQHLQKAKPIPTITTIRPQQYENFLTYQYQDFKLDRPHNWVVITDHKAINKNYVVVFKNLPLDSIAALGIAMEDNSKNTALEDLSELYLKGLRHDSPNFQLIEAADKINWGGQAAYKIVYDELIQNILARHIQIFTIRNTKIFTLLFNSEVDKFSECLPTVTRMIESFSFIDKTGK